MPSDSEGRSGGADHRGSAAVFSLAFVYAGDVVAGLLASAVGVKKAVLFAGDAAVVESLVDVIGSVADHHHDDDDDNDDAKEGDADAESAADTASAESGLGGLGAFVARFSHGECVVVFLRIQT